MGQNKALLHYHHRSQLIQTLGLLRPFSTELSCSIGDQSRLRHHLPPSTIALLDERPGGGPIEGIRSALSYDPSSAWIILAVDLPALTQEDIALLIRERDPSQYATFFGISSENFEPTCAIYEPKALQVIKSAIQQGIRSLHRIFAHLPIKIVQPRPHALFNANTPDDRERFRAQPANPG